MVGLALDKEVDDHPASPEDRPILRKFVYVAAVPLSYATFVAVAFPFVILWEGVLGPPLKWLNSMVMWPVEAVAGAMPQSVRTLLEWALTGLGILMFGWFSYLGIRILGLEYRSGTEELLAERSIEED